MTLKGRGSSKNCGEQGYVCCIWGPSLEEMWFTGLLFYWEIGRILPGAHRWQSHQWGVRAQDKGSPCKRGGGTGNIQGQKRAMLETGWNLVIPQGHHILNILENSLEFLFLQLKLSLPWQQAKILFTAADTFFGVPESMVWRPVPKWRVEFLPNEFTPGHPP